MPQFIKGFIGLVLFGALGFYISVHSWGGETFISAKNLNNLSLRDPAAVKKVFDFSQFEGNVFSSSSQKRLIQDAQIEKQAGRFGVSLGHYVARMNDGQRVLACQAYDKVTLNFEAEGVAVDGEIPSMQIEGNCFITDQMSRMGSLWVPVNKILASAPSEGEFSFTEEQVVVRFSHISDSWPTKWHLKSVNLSDSLNGRPAVAVLSKEAGYSVRVDWSTL